MPKYMTFKVSRSYVHSKSIEVQVDFEGTDPTPEEIERGRQEALAKISDTVLDDSIYELEGTDQAEIEGWGE